ncbi:glycosyltransferase [Nocardioides sp. cx-169]|uniref:glycosyltransferase n=1 Tax=Nocardioides sp. cx-169 TaxID=2899080 RepID=UPI001E64FC9E|nr:glycosyltransferase [Nocardioides sp. cx-169]MCD4533750.1 glycosyltransferase [Nocardioides sp. cx-169]
MKIVQINNVYSSGSTGRITSNLHHDLIRRGHQSSVLYGRGRKSDDAQVVKVASEKAAKWNAAKARAYSLQYAGSEFATRRIIRHLEREKPDIVHMQCLNGYFVNIYALLDWLRVKDKTCVLTLHAEFMHTGGCGHALDCDKWRLTPGCGRCPQLRDATKSFVLDRTREGWERMENAFRGFSDQITIVSVSPWLQARAQASPILSHLKHQTVLNGLDDDVFRRTTPAPIEMHRNADQKVLLHVTPLFDASPTSFKGGQDVVALARQLGSRVKVVVLGDVAPGAGKQLPENVVCVGRISDARRLAAFYTAADATLLTSRRETFSMVTAESLACGTPVIGYRAGGPEQIALPDHSTFVAQGDLPALAAAVELSTQSTELEREAMSLRARDKYSNRRMTTEYLQIYRSAMARDTK